ncbi:Ig-like domain-containing protein, partial [Phaeodactylibacter luteus]|uniref:Ig-like domain-containing protein n=1 Tax=Phaeodactylibacter luteus TaxID=1564516 RepID=UPI001478DF1E
TLITLVAGPMNGMLTLNLDGTFTYTPDLDFNGMDTFEYSYCDGGTPELCDTASVDITVNAVNDAPIANND